LYLADNYFRVSPCNYTGILRSSAGSTFDTSNRTFFGDGVHLFVTCLEYFQFVGWMQIIAYTSSEGIIGMVKVVSIAVSNQIAAAEALAMQIEQQLLAHKKVLWLVSGGSSLPIAKLVADRLHSIDSSRLFVGLVDDVAAPDSVKPTNWQQLRALGFDLPAAPLRPILQTGVSMAASALTYGQQLHRWLSTVDFSIGQFGLGEGYHTGGILPGSPAASESTRLVIAYDTSGIWRVTVTPILIGRLDVAFINSFGESKRPLVEHFLISQASIVDEPTQSLKTAARTMLYSDVV
jgi:6-phosphogluconolactonase/glucosamine-6-phosphate isomerase/deaminase